ncbi:MAG: hypothetical protein CVT47_03105 [Thermoplasmata archaeon HGW-Thermoplasmata-2]|nr:MAG: hypothetical protein CVT47_03105 [Thermoplasmata archaeon HGW-Thermoplasmata-2]
MAVKINRLVAAVAFGLVAAGIFVPIFPEAAAQDSFYIPHAPIRINGNSDFNELNGVSGGSGTEDDPYVIRGWEIDASRSDGIIVENTDARLIIKDCRIRGGGDEHTGIWLKNVSNTEIENVISIGDLYGFRLQDSSGVIVRSCTAARLNSEYADNDRWVSTYGIWLERSSKIEISGCAVYENVCGIRLDDSDSNTIFNCYAYNNSKLKYGILLYSSSDNTVSNCTAYQNYCGIYVYGDSFRNVIENCNVSGNIWRGIYVSEGSSSGSSTISYGAARGASLLVAGEHSNLVRRNNIIDNMEQAYDSCAGNTWRENYWSDYEGADMDSDGYGDIPHLIMGGSSADARPRMQPISNAGCTDEVGAVEFDLYAPNPDDNDANSTGGRIIPGFEALFIISGVAVAAASIGIARRRR